MLTLLLLCCLRPPQCPMPPQAPPVWDVPMPKPARACNCKSGCGCDDCECPPGRPEGKGWQYDKEKDHWWKYAEVGFPTKPRFPTQEIRPIQENLSPVMPRYTPAPAPAFAPAWSFPSRSAPSCPGGG